MKTGLSKREKILLFVVGLLALFYAAIQFGIMPLSARYNDGVNERNRLSDEKARHEMEVVVLPQLRDRAAQANTDFTNLKSDYPQLGPTEEIDRLLTQLCDKNALKISLLNIVKSDASPPPNQDITYDEDGNPLEEDETAPPPVFTKVSVQMNVSGSYSSLLSLFDDVSATTYIHIKSVSFTENRHEESVNVASIALTFEITYLAV